MDDFADGAAPGDSAYEPSPAAESSAEFPESFPEPQSHADSQASVIQALYNALTGAHENPSTPSQGSLADLVLDVFRLYVARGSRLNDAYVSHANFLALLRAGGLVSSNSPTSMARADIIYTKVLRGARARHGLTSVLGHDKGLTPETLPWALALVAVERAPRLLGLAPHESVAPGDVPLLLEWLGRSLEYAAQAVASNAESQPVGGDAAAVVATAAALDSPAAAAALQRADGLLRRLFFGYTRPSGTTRRGGLGAGGAPSGEHAPAHPQLPGVGSVATQTGGMDFAVLSRLCGHYRLAPGLVSKAFLFSAFSSLATPAVDSAGKAGGAAMLNFQQVSMSALGGVQAPEPPPSLLSAVCGCHGPCRCTRRSPAAALADGRRCGCGCGGLRGRAR